MSRWTTLKTQLDAAGVNGEIARAARQLIAHGPTPDQMGHAGANTIAESSAAVDVLYAIRKYFLVHMNAPTLDQFRREHAACTDEICAAWRNPQQPGEGFNL